MQSSISFLLLFSNTDLYSRTLVNATEISRKSIKFLSKFPTQLLDKQQWDSWKAQPSDSSVICVARDGEQDTSAPFLQTARVHHG